VVLNVVLIPKLNGSGAAIAFFATTLLQAVLYYRLVHKQIMEVSVRPFFLLSISATIVYAMVICIPVHYSLQLLIAAIFYTSIAIITKQIDKKQISNVKYFLAR
jgi:O-antigen/teichoic acid export membrane protein